MSRKTERTLGTDFEEQVKEASKALGRGVSPLASRLLMSLLMGRIKDPGNRPMLREKESLGPARRSGSHVCSSLPVSCYGELSAAFSGSLDEWTSSGTDDDPDQRTSQRGHPDGVTGREGNRTGTCNEPQEVEFILSHTGYRDM